jgi:hypothetical protein
MTKKQLDALKAIGGTYARAFIAGMGTTYLMGKTDPKSILAAGVAGVIPVLMRWANPKDSFPNIK